MDRNSNLVLVRASVSRPNGSWPDDAYDVWDGDAKAVGCIFRATVTPTGRPWFWTITERGAQQPTQRGYAATREQAMADFKAAWER